MFKKLISRSESSQIEINDSALRDIIPSNDGDMTKKAKQKRFTSVCKILILMFILGLIAIGIVLLGLFLAYSGKFFMKFLTQSSDGNFLQSSNRTRALSFDQENTTETSNEQNWKKITVIPTDNNQQVYESSSRIRTKQGIESYLSMDTTVKKESTSTTMQTTTPTRQSTVTRKNPEYVQTSLENKIMTADTYTSSSIIQKIRNYETTISEKIPSLRSSTNTNMKKMILKKYQQTEEDNIVDDILYK